MTLSDKMKSLKDRCGFRDSCRREAHRAYFQSLFDKKREVFEIRRDPQTKGFFWQTLCCAISPAAKD